MADEHDELDTLGDSEFDLDSTEMDSKSDEFDDFSFDMDESGLGGRKPASPGKHIMTKSFQALGKGVLKGVKTQLAFAFPNVSGKTSS